MPRLLNDKPCEVTFHDRISDSDITLCYRLPTTEERIAYANEHVIRKGGAIKNNTGAARVKYGLLILTGFKEGAFAKEEGKPLSCDPQSPHYDAAWKTVVRKYASDILSLLAVHAFDASVVTAPEDEEDEEGAGEDPS